MADKGQSNNSIRHAGTTQGSAHWFTYSEAARSTWPLSAYNEHTRVEIKISDSVAFCIAILKSPIKTENDRSTFSVVSAIYEAETLSVKVFKIQPLFL